MATVAMNLSRQHMPRWLAVIVLLFAFIPVTAVGPDDAEIFTVDELACTEIVQFIKQLDSDNFEEREEATKRLKEIGEPAMEALESYPKAGMTLEQRRRVEAIVTFLEIKLYGERLRVTHPSDADLADEAGVRGIVYCVAVSPDSKRVLTAGHDKRLRLWDTESGKQLRVFSGHTERVLSADFSPDGKHVLSGSGDKAVRLWDANTGELIHAMTGHTSDIWSVAFGPPGQAVSTGLDQMVWLWDLHTGGGVRAFKSHTDYLSAVVYSGTAKVAAVGGNRKDPSIRLWNLETGTEIRRIVGHRGAAHMRLCFSPDGTRLLSTADGTVRIWDVQTGNERLRIEDAQGYCARISPNGKRIVSGGYHYKTPGIVRLWDAASGKLLRTYKGHSNSVTCVAFFPDGTRIITAGYDGTARVWPLPR